MNISVTRSLFSQLKGKEMKKSGFSRLSVIMFVLIIGLAMVGQPMSAEEVAKMEVGKIYHGFKLIKQKKVNELDGVGLQFEHVKSGARLLKIKNADTNKAFSIAFRTPPPSDNGVAHIMEHSVLNGSKKFPVKSPFREMSKGSLRTFLNAMTSKDRTVYPVASMNQKDFMNLMDVYLDAVLFPRIYDEPKIFLQEAWHYELNDKKEDLVYKGVVHGEMKGAFSSPERELYYQTNKNIYPDNAYHYTSGGYPSAIPSLTYEGFKDFHSKYYHPSNSYIYLYGDGDMMKELAFIDSNYLSKFERKNVDSSIPLQKPFAKMKDVTAEYAISATGDTKDKTFLSLNFLAGKATDMELVLALNILSDVLVNYPSAPIRQAMVKAGIGKDVDGDFDDYQQNVFYIMARNTNPEDKEKFKAVVFDTLKKIVKEGLDKKVLEGAVNRLAFRLREADEMQGVNSGRAILTGWLFADDPFLTLQYEAPLEKLLKAVKTDYFEKVIEKHFLNNNHCLLLTLKPSKELGAKRVETVKKHLAEYKASLSDAQLDKIIQQTKELKKFQSTPDTQENLATIPMLSITDINPEAKKVQVTEKSIETVKVLAYPVFTNNIFYVRLMYDATVVPQELLPYVELMGDVLTQLNTKKYSYGEFSTLSNIYTGGIRVGTNVYRKDNDHKNPLLQLVVRGRVMKENLGKMLDLQGELMGNTIFNDTKRLKEVLTMVQSRQEASAKRNGIGLAITRLQSYVSPYGKIREITGGLSYYRFVTKLAKEYDKKAPEIIANLQKVAELVFNKKNLIVGVTCSESDYKLFAETFPRLLSDMGDKTPKPQTYTYKFGNKNEALASASKVQYVIQGYNFKELGYAHDGSMNVLQVVLSREYLTQKVRIMGGAYGGFAGISQGGFVFFGSYRDPNLKETVEIYKKTPEFVKNFETTDTNMTRLIIGTIADMDSPQSPRNEGNTAISNYFQGNTHDKVRQRRKEVLATTPDTIRNFTKMITDGVNKGLICVYGNEQKIEENKTLFDKIIKVVE